MSEGTIATVLIQKNFGFIKPSEGGDDLYFRISDTSIPTHGLRKGVKVKFDTRNNTQGPVAVNIHPVGNYLPQLMRARGTVKFFNDEQDFGYIMVDGYKDVHIARRSTVFENQITPGEGDEVYVDFYIESNDTNPQGTKVKIIHIAERKIISGTALSSFAEMGPQSNWNTQLANMAEKENWDYTIKPTGRTPILDSYLRYTYARLDEERKIAVSSNEQYATFNTGLVTPNQEEIFAYFRKNSVAGAQPWLFIGFRKTSDRDLLREFGANNLPDVVNYFSDPSVLIYDRRYKLIPNIDHILERLERFPESLQNDPYRAMNAVNAASARAEKRVARNYKAAIPQWFRDKNGKDSKIQLLLPLCLESEDKADLALVVEREDNYNRGNTVLPLDMAYKNARLIARPDGEWLIP